MIFTFTGPQCSGKSTLLQKCKEVYGDKLYYVEEVTRLIKREHNVPINENAAADSTQILILNKEFQNLSIDYKARKHQAILHDRCLLDGLVFTEYFAEQELLKPEKDRINFHISTSLAKQYFANFISKYDHIFYPNPHDVELIDDGERSINKNFRNCIINKYESVWLNDERIKNKLTILKGTVEERMEAIKIKLNEHGIR
jgi:nicotinamide riboside kinase